MQRPGLQQLMYPVELALRLAPAYGRLAVLAIAGLLSLLLLSLAADSMETAEEKLGALGWTLQPQLDTEQRIIIVAIDEKSIAEVGPWPWERSELARLTNALNEAGVQLQFHDIVYTEPRTGDDQLLSALQSSPGAILAQVPVLQSEQELRSGLMTNALTGLDCANFATNTSNYLAPHSAFSSVAKGHITTPVASDGSIRNIPAIICVDDQAYPALALSAMLVASNADDWSASLRAGSGLFGPDRVLTLDAYPGLQIPLDAGGNLRVSYQNSPEVYQAVSAVDVMNGRIDTDMLQNTWVLVGATAFGIGDIVPTPYSGATPGVELQARLLGSILDTEVPYTPAAAESLLFGLTLVFAGALFGLASGSNRLTAWGLPVAAVLLPVSAWALHVQLLATQNLWLGWMLPAIYALLGASLLMLLELARVRMERNRVYGNLSSYLPVEFAREIAYSLPSSSINARKCQVTLLSADLRNFAAFGEARPAEESAAVLHFFFSRAAEIVEHSGGRIHEFKGDSLLAVWDGHDAQAARQALQAAQAMQTAIHQDELPLHSPQGLEPLVLGIGIEQGPVLMGAIGPAHRRTHTLLGDTVTIALRIQELTADLAQPILIGECAARQLADSNLQSQGSYLLNGLRIPHTLYAPSGGEQGQRKSRGDQPSLKVLSGGRA